MSTVKSVSQYIYSNPVFGVLQYNTLNGMYYGSTATTNRFLSDIKSIYDSQLYQTEIVVIATTCAFLVLICIQIPTGYALNKAVSGQVDIFLQLPNRACAKLAKSSNEFVNRIQVLAAGIMVKVEHEVRLRRHSAREFGQPIRAFAAWLAD